MDDLRDVCAALSYVLEYPRHAPQGTAVKITRMLERFDAPDLKARFEGPLTNLARGLQGRMMSELQREHVAVFDKCPECSLCLAWQKYGDAPPRARALAELYELYSETGLRLQAGRTPDYLPLMLEYLAFAPAWAVEIVCDGFMAEVDKFGKRLSATQGVYAAAGFCLSLLAETFPEQRFYRTTQKHYDLFYPSKRQFYMVC